MIENKEKVKMKEMVHKEVKVYRRTEEEKENGKERLKE